MCFGFSVTYTISTCNHRDGQLNSDRYIEFIKKKKKKKKKTQIDLNKKHMCVGLILYFKCTFTSIFWFIFDKYPG